MAASFAPFSISGLAIGGSHVKRHELCLTKRNVSGLGLGLGLGLGPGFGPKLAVQRKSSSVMISNGKSSICAEYRDNSEGGCGAGDFLAGFLLGSAILGTVAYIFAPQIRKSLLNEDEYGFRKAKIPIYYDERLERTRQALNKKIKQLNSVIDNVSSRLRRGKNASATEIGTDPEMEATM